MDYNFHLDENKMICPFKNFEDMEIKLVKTIEFDTLRNFLKSSKTPAVFLTCLLVIILVLTYIFNINFPPRDLIEIFIILPIMLSMIGILIFLMMLCTDLFFWNKVKNYKYTGLRWCCKVNGENLYITEIIQAKIPERMNFINNGILTAQIDANTKIYNLSIRMNRITYNFEDESSIRYVRFNLNKVSGSSQSGVLSFINYTNVYLRDLNKIQRDITSYLYRKHV